MKTQELKQEILKQSSPACGMWHVHRKGMNQEFDRCMTAHQTYSFYFSTPEFAADPHTRGFSCRFGPSDIIPSWLGTMPEAIIGFAQQVTKGLLLA